MYVKILKY